MILLSNMPLTMLDTCGIFIATALLANKGKGVL